MKKVGIVLNKHDGKDRIILRGPIYGGKNPYVEDHDDYICPSNFKKALDQVETDEVEVVINSQGGDVFAAIEIYNMLVESGKEVTTVVSGRAFSGGHIIAMAGDRRLIYDNSQGLAHRASTIAWGNALEMLEVVDHLEKIDDNIMNIYETVYTGTREELEDLLNSDKAINAQECVDLGFATEIVTRKREPEVAAEKLVEVSAEGSDLEALAEKVVELLGRKKKVEDEPKGLFEYFKEDK